MTICQVDSLRAKLLKLIDTNASLEADDPEKLERGEFIVDLEQQEVWRRAGDETVAQLRKQIEIENLGKELLVTRRMLKGPARAVLGAALAAARHASPASCR